jgi:CheY-like chemotaxis protein
VSARAGGFIIALGAGSGDRMCRILLVEDDHDIRESAAGLLNSCGHLVVEAENGRDALDWLSGHIEEPPCMAIVDMMMPVMDGWELIGTLRDDPRWKKLYVIVFSAVRSRSDIENEVAANDFWPKPPRIDELERIRAHCPYHGRSAGTTVDLRGV